MGRRSVGTQSKNERGGDVRPAVAHALAFARRVAARHRRAVGRSPALGLLLRRISSHRRSVAFRAGDTTRVFALRLGPFQVHRERPTAPVAVPATGRGHTNPITRIRTRPSRLNVVRRAAAEATQSPRVAREMMPPRGPDRIVRSAPVRQVLRKAPSQSTPSAEVTRPIAETPHRRDAAQPLVIPSAEVERLTSHVLRTLDRRLGAFRERRGKV